MLDAKLFARMEPQPDGCWRWRGRYGGKGRARIRYHGKTTHVYLIVYEALHGPVGPGQHVHHRCENPSCVNPAHLEALTVSEHWRAHNRVPPRHQSLKTHCPQGHAYDEANTYVHNGKRFCRACHRASAARRKQQLEAARSDPRGLGDGLGS